MRGRGAKGFSFRSQLSSESQESGSEGLAFSVCAFFVGAVISDCLGPPSRVGYG
jgi:hypothetical protein